MQNVEMYIEHINDIVTFYLDGKFVKTVSRLTSERPSVNLSCNADCELTIIVETFGHKNDGADMETDQKGIFGKITLGG